MGIAQATRQRGPSCGRRGGASGPEGGAAEEGAEGPSLREQAIEARTPGSDQKTPSHKIFDGLYGPGTLISSGTVPHFFHSLALRFRRVWALREQNL